MAKTVGTPLDSTEKKWRHETSSRDSLEFTMAAGNSVVFAEAVSLMGKRVLISMSRERAHELAAWLLSK